MAGVVSLFSEMVVSFLDVESTPAAGSDAVPESVIIVVMVTVTAATPISGVWGRISRRNGHLMGPKQRQRNRTTWNYLMPGFGRDQATGRAGCSEEMSRKWPLPANRKKLPTDEKKSITTAAALSGTPSQHGQPDGPRWTLADGRQWMMASADGE